MKYSDYLHGRSRALLRVAIREASERGITCEATLSGIIDESDPFPRCDLRAQRIWHDEFHRQMGATRRLATAPRGQS
jgi:hypothetical protein